MKKAFLLLLALCLLLPAFSSALEIDPYYAYCHVELTKSGSPYMATLYFTEDQKVFFSCQMFYEDEPGLGRSFIGEWEYTPEGEIFAKIGNTATMTLHLSSLGGEIVLVDKETMSCYFPVSVLMN